MNREDAYYYKNLLMLGFSDEYTEWLNHRLETEDPLSDIVLELAYCSSDVKHAVSLLHMYCEEQQFDVALVADRLRVFFQGAYYSNKMSKEEVVTTMFRLARNVGFPCNYDLNIHYDLNIWANMYQFYDYYSLAKDAIISWESFDFAFFSYLDHGAPFDIDLLWEKNTKKKPSLLKRIKNILKRIFSIFI